MGDGQEHGDDPAWDAAEANALYDLLERVVIPEFYNRDENGIPAAWIKRMRESMARLTPQFSTNRTVREYTEQHYLPAAATYCARAADRGAAGGNIVKWKQTLQQQGASLRFGEVKVQTHGAQHLFEAEVHLHDVDPDFVCVELYANGMDSHQPVRQEMTRLRPVGGEPRGGIYVASVPATRPVTDYTARIVPQRAGVAVPLEANFIHWQR